MRRRKAPIREVLGDPIYGNKVVTKSPPPRAKQCKRFNFVQNVRKLFLKWVENGRAL